MTVPTPFIDLMLDGEWTDVTTDVRLDNGITITRGRADEASRVNPGKAPLAFNNKAGKYSPRNPSSPLFGRISRNTPVRVGVGDPSAGGAGFVPINDEGGVALDLDHTAPSVNARTSNSLLLCAWIAAMSGSSGDYTVPASMTADVEVGGSNSTMVSAAEALADAGATGTRTATFSTTEDFVAHATVSLALAAETGVPVVEEFLADESDTDDITFLTSAAEVGWWLVAVHVYHIDPDDELPFQPGGTAGRWRMLADSVVATGDGPHLRAWMRPVDVAGIQEVVFETADRLLNNHARLWVVSGVPFSSVRFAGEVSSWPQRWDPSEADVWVPVEAAGIMRRLGQGTKPLHSAIYRETLVPAKRAPRAYWPCEDEEGSKFIASALEGGTPMLVVDVDGADLASFDGFAGSEPLPVLNTGRFFGDVPAYTVTGETQARWVLHVDPDGATDGQQILTVYTDTNLRWEVIYHVTGDLSARVFGPDGDGDVVVLQDSGPLNFNIDGLLVRMALEIHQEGADIRYTVGVLEAGAETASSLGDQFVNGRTAGRVRRVTVGEGRNLGKVAFGHLSVHDEVTTIFDLGDALNGWDGEAAGQRFTRLCREEGIPSVVTGDHTDTIVMGPQRSDTFLNLLGEVADADGGILHETRDDLGLSYRTGRSLYNQGQT